MAGHVFQQSDLFRGARVVRARLPLLVRAAWVPGDRLPDGRCEPGVILVDDRLDEAAACAAIVEVALEARELAAEREALGANVHRLPVAQRRVRRLGDETELDRLDRPGRHVDRPLGLDPLATMSRAELRRALLARLFGRGAA